MIEVVCWTVAHSSARAACAFHFFDQPREVLPRSFSLSRLYLQFEVAGPIGKGGLGAPLTWSM
jgi:hypothetical protein